MLSSAEQILRHEARPLSGADADYDRLLDLVGDASVVLLATSRRPTRAL